MGVFYLSGGWGRQNANEQHRDKLHQKANQRYYSNLEESRAMSRERNRRWLIRRQEIGIPGEAERQECHRLPGLHQTASFTVHGGRLRGKRPFFPHVTLVPLVPLVPLDISPGASGSSVPSALLVNWRVFREPYSLLQRLECGGPTHER